MKILIRSAKTRHGMVIMNGNADAAPNIANLIPLFFMTSQAAVATTGEGMDILRGKIEEYAGKF